MYCRDTNVSESCNTAANLYPEKNYPCVGDELAHDELQQSDTDEDEYNVDWAPRDDTVSSTDALDAHRCSELFAIAEEPSPDMVRQMTARLIWIRSKLKTHIYFKLHKTVFKKSLKFIFIKKDKNVALLLIIITHDMENLSPLCSILLTIFLFYDIISLLTIVSYCLYYFSRNCCRCKRFRLNLHIFRKVVCLSSVACHTCAPCFNHSTDLDAILQVQWYSALLLIPKKKVNLDFESLAKTCNFQIMAQPSVQCCHLTNTTKKRFRFSPNYFGIAYVVQLRRVYSCLWKKRSFDVITRILI